jgi:hypothetical protein
VLPITAPTSPKKGAANNGAVHGDIIAIVAWLSAAADKFFGRKETIVALQAQTVE